MQNFQRNTESKQRIRITERKSTMKTKVGEPNEGDGNRSTNEQTH